VVVRNIAPERKPAGKRKRKDFDLPDDRFILILQGSGINIQRGAEEMVLAMQFIEKALLLIVGGGDVLEHLKQLVKENRLEDRVIFKPRQPYEQLLNLPL